MECNREEAVRARDLALEKFSKQDFFGAKKFMLKAQQLFPTLEGLAQLLAIVEVHSVSQNKVGIGGLEMDWYGILQVPFGSDENTVKKQYRKLALLLHPDKNKAQGAEAAFKLIGEAWAILSDKTKRVLHDLKRSAKVTTNARVSTEQQKRTQQQYKAAAPAPAPAPAPTPAQARPGSAAGPARAPARGAPAAKFAGQGRGANQPANQPHDTFWTCCPGCKMQYQYQIAYQNYQLKCHKCHYVFMARDITAGNGGYFNFKPPVPPSPVPPVPQPPPANAANAAAGNGFANGGFGTFPSSYPTQNSPFFSPAAAEAVAQSKVAAAAAAAAAATTSSPANNPSANVVHQTFYRVKRDRVQNKRKDKEEQLKSQDPARQQEAMDRLMAKRDERLARDSIKRKMDGKRKLKRRKRPSDDEEDADQEDPDSTSEIGGDPSLFDDLSSPSMPRRRSSRAKKNVASYKVDASDDDSDLDDFQAPKRAKANGEESDDPQDGTSNGRSENGSKGKGIADDGNTEKRPAGERAEDLEKAQMPSRPRSGTEEDGDGQNAALKKDKSASNVGADGRKFAPFRREYDRQESEAHKMRAGKSAQDVEQSGATAKEAGDQEVGGFKDARVETKSPKTHRVRVNSPKVLHHPGQGMNDDERKGQKAAAAAAAAASAASSGFSSPDRDVDDDEEEADDSIDVPDPDFHDFDAERTERDLHSGQIWAMYDDEDGMPRFYGRISRVSIRPFKVNLTWLEYVPSTQQSKQMMDSTGLSIGAGAYRLARPAVIARINTFSHVVVVDEKPPTGQVRIYPKKDQVWAVFRDWNAENFGPLKIRKSRGGSNAYNYDMVLVLSDYLQGRGARTVKLMKVGGYKTLFHRLAGEEAIQVYKDVERFSHSVPKWVLEDALIETHGVPPGSLELDPAATPMDLINAPAPAPGAH